MHYTAQYLFDYLFTDYLPAEFAAELYNVDSETFADMLQPEFDLTYEEHKHVQTLHPEFQNILRNNFIFDYAEEEDTSHGYYSVH